MRGAQSSLWGSDAMGSVVQVFTRRAGAGTTGVAADAEAGSFGTARGDARVHGVASRVDYHAGITSRRTSGAFDDVLPEEDRFDQTAFDGGVWRCARVTRSGAHRPARVRRRTAARSARSPTGLATPAPEPTRADLSWHLDVSHSLGAMTTGRASVLYFRSSSDSADTVEDPFFNVYTLLRGTPGAPFPGQPAAGAAADRESEFSALSPDQPWARRVPGVHAVRGERLPVIERNASSGVPPSAIRPTWTGRRGSG